MTIGGALGLAISDYKNLNITITTISELLFPLNEASFRKMRLAALA